MPLGVPWVSPGCLLGVSWMLLGASWVLLGVSWLLLAASWESPGCLLGGSGCSWVPLGVSWVLLNLTLKYGGPADVFIRLAQGPDCVCYPSLSACHESEIGTYGAPHFVLDCVPRPLLQRPPLSPSPGCRALPLSLPCLARCSGRRSLPLFSTRAPLVGAMPW